MMNRTIDIKLDKSSHFKDYKAELAQWESEGGNAAELNETLDDVTLPLKRGDIFEVMDVSIVSEGPEYFYRVEIKVRSTAFDRID